MLKLVVGNRNYSSWSLRPWLLLTEAGIPFDEVPLSLYTLSFRAGIAPYAPARQVPVLVDPDAGDGRALVIWDSLAIVEYLAERFPERELWPADRAARARARSVCAEMHAGFATLRQSMPFNSSADLAGHGWSVAVQDDIDRIVVLWRDCLERSGGPLLFGPFGIADAFFAPVASRFRTYGVALPADMAAYRDRLMALDGMRAWDAGAATERAFLAGGEPYRRRG